jgi:LPS export ABC transporter protein LptC
LKTVSPILLIGAIAALAIAGVVSCSKADKSAPTAPASDKVEDGAFGKIADFTYMRTVEGRKEFELKAAAAIYFEKGQRADLEKANITFFAEDGGRVDVSADKGTLWTDTMNVEAAGHIVIRSSLGYRAYAEKLAYKADARLIHTDAPVLLVDDKMTLTGNGLRMALESQKLELLDSVKATVIH